MFGNAQSWCPPGATWTYTHSNNWTHEGYARYQYIGDTVIDGNNAQIISMHAAGYDFSMQANFSWDQGPYFTTVMEAWSAFGREARSTHFTTSVQASAINGR